MRKRDLWFKAVSVLVVSAFLAMDIAWAYPDHKIPTNTLAAESLFQQKTMAEYSERFRLSELSDMNTVASVLNISKYLLGDKADGANPLPLEYMVPVMEKW